MGCAQSSTPSSHRDKRRNSREFYHGYNVQTTPTTKHQHAFVNTKPIQPVHHQRPLVAIPAKGPTVPPLPLQQQQLAAGRSQAAMTSQSPPSLADKVPNGNGPAKRSNAAAAAGGDGGDDMHFRRQHFDRNSVLRHSKKRSRKTSSASLNKHSASQRSRRTSVPSEGQRIWCVLDDGKS